MTYIDPALIDDETAVGEAILAALADLLPGWEASEGHVETAQAEALGIVAATIAAVILEREREDYAGFGANVLELDRHAAEVASALVTITLNISTGATIPAGFQFVVPNPDGEEYAFATTQDAVVPNGETQAHDVPAQALDTGEAPNDSVGVAVQHDDLAVVATAEVLVPAAGGAEQEPIEDYLDRVISAARRVRALPITPEDYAAHALDVAWVDRAIAVNRVDPATAPADAPGHVTIYAVDSDGNPGTGGNLTLLQAHLDALETVRGTIAHADEAGTVDIDVAASVRAADGYSDAEAEGAAEAAITTGLARAVWNLDEDTPGRWRAIRLEVTRYDISALIDDLPEIEAVTSVTLNGGAGPIAVPETSVARATPVAVTAV